MLICEYESHPTTTNIMSKVTMNNLDSFKYKKPIIPKNISNQ